jgi:hypothetical protein
MAATGSAGRAIRLGARPRSRAGVQPAGWLLALLLACLSPLSHGADGTLLMVSGAVEIVRPSPGGGASSITPVTGDPVAAGDLLDTGDDGRAQIRFTDGSVVSLQPRTRFTIDEYRFDPNGQRGVFGLVRGALRTVTGAIGKRNHDDYRLITPTATVGVRGTEYVAEETVCDPGCRPGRSAGLRVAVSEGRVVVANRAGSAEVAAGSAVHATDPDSPVRPTEERPVLSSSAMPRLAQAGTHGSGAPAAPASAGGAASGGLLDALAAMLAGGPPPVDAAAIAAASGDAPAAAPTKPSTRKAPLGAASATSARDEGAGEPAGGDDETGIASLPADAAATNQWRTPAGLLAAVVGAAAAQGADGLGGDVDLVTVVSPGATDPAAAGPGDGAGPGGDPDLVTVVSPGGTDPATAGPGGDAAPGWPGLVLAPNASYDVRLLGLWLLQTPRLQGLLSGGGSQVTLDGDRALLSIGTCPGTRCLSRGTATVADGGADSVASWGRWIDGEARTSALGLDTSHPQSPRAGMHYLVGIPTLTMPTSGAASYSLIGATQPTFSDGARMPGSFAGAAVVQFGSGLTTRVALDAQVRFEGDATYRFATTGGLANPSATNLTMTGANAFQGTLAVQTGPDASALGCSASVACKATVTGGFLGPAASTLGLGYTIAPAGGGSQTTINGVGVLRRDP